MPSIPQIVQKKWLWFGISALMIIPVMIVLAVSGVRVGIDFKSGAVLEYETGASVTNDAVVNSLKDVDLKTKTVQLSGDKAFRLKTDALSEGEHEKIKSAISAAFKDAKETRYETVGPTIGKKQTNDAVLRVVIASIAIILYIAWAFRKIPKPANSWKFGFAAVAALLHDLLFVVGMFALLGRFFDFIEVDSLFITALLTVMGFSVHDTIVVFDRIRENLRLNPGAPFADVANMSIVQTLARSLNTSLTVLLVLLVLFLLGGESTKGFTLALLLGIAVGTYSSIFNATPLLVMWQERSKKH